MRPGLLRVLASLALLALSPFALAWLMRWPVFARELRSVSLIHDFHVGRRQFLWDLVIRKGEDVEYAICVLCSVRIEGSVERDVVALWGNVHVVTGGKAPDQIEAKGGSAVLDSGATIPYIPSIVALGGTVRVHPALIDSVVRLVDHARQQSIYTKARSDPIAPPRPNAFPSFYYPGQRTPTLIGVAAVIGGFAIVALLGTVIVPPSRLAAADEGVRHPVRSATRSVVVLAGFLFIAWMFRGVLYFFPPAWFAVIAFLEWLWFAFAVGLGAFCRFAGERAGRGRSISPLPLGTVVIATLLVVPVVGAMLQPVLMIAATGAGLRALTSRP